MSSEKSDSTVRHQLIVGDDLNERIERHIRVVRHIKPGKFKKHDWLLEAIEEMMGEWKKGDKQSAIPHERRLTIRLNDAFSKELEKIVNYQKKFRSYSKAKWFSEAILKKLENEENLVKEWIEKNQV